MSEKISIAALTFEVVVAEGKAPAEFRMLPSGYFRATDGRPAEVDNWHMDDQIAARVIARANARKAATVIDYEHQSIRKDQNGKPAPAAGWFCDLEFREDGLYVMDARWTKKATAHIKDDEYRYISPVFSYSPKTGEVYEILSVALTNNPALDDLEPLAALARNLSNTNTNTKPTGGTMSDEEKKAIAALSTQLESMQASVVALTAERDAGKASVAALTAERDGLKEKLATVEKTAAEAAAAQEEKTRKDLIEAALSKKTMTPPERPAFEAMDLSVAKQLLEAREPIADLSRQSAGKSSGAAEGATHGLCAEELAMCSKMGLTPAAFAAEKARLA